MVSLVRDLYSRGINEGYKFILKEYKWELIGA